eukprot:m51a1_g2160 hypothetical protein (82) ;mRNA; r:39459-39704
MKRTPLTPQQCAAAAPKKPRRAQGPAGDKENQPNSRSVAEAAADVEAARSALRAATECSAVHAVSVCEMRWSQWLGGDQCS